MTLHIHTIVKIGVRSSYLTITWFLFDIYLNIVDIFQSHFKNNVEMYKTVLWYTLISRIKNKFQVLANRFVFVPSEKSGKSVVEVLRKSYMGVLKNEIMYFSTAKGVRYTESQIDNNHVTTLYLSLMPHMNIGSYNILYMYLNVHRMLQSHSLLRSSSPVRIIPVIWHVCISWSHIGCFTKGTNLICGELSLSKLKVWVWTLLLTPLDFDLKIVSFPDECPWFSLGNPASSDQIEATVVYHCSKQIAIFE